MGESGLGQEAALSTEFGGTSGRPGLHNSHLWM
jgi:hypothetical protein